MPTLENTTSTRNSRLRGGLVLATLAIAAMTATPAAAAGPSLGTLKTAAVGEPAPKTVPAKARKAVRRSAVLRQRRQSRRPGRRAGPRARASMWYDGYRVLVGASCYHGAGHYLLVDTPIIKPLSGTYQWVAFKADYISSTGQASYSDWWWGYTTNWGEYVTFSGGYKFINARTGERKYTPSLMHQLLPGNSNVRLRVAWYSGNSLVRHITIWFQRGDYRNCYY